MNSQAIVVGVDGTVPSHAAVRWAAREAVRRGVAVRLVHAYDWNWEGARYDGGPEFRDLAEDRAAAVTSAASHEAHNVAPELRPQTRSLIGDPVPQLIEEAADASLVVLGNRGRGGFASLLLGSVSQRVATHSPGPVVIVRGRVDTTDGPVVVGVDDSPAADDVLATAFEFAAGRGCPLVAVRSYFPPPPLWAGDVPPSQLPTPESDASERERLLDQLAGWRQKYPEVRVEALVTHAGAAAVLVGVSHTAQLVVVGSRGHGAVAGTLLGSTGLQLIHHADCPVLIARSPATGQGA